MARVPFFSDHRRLLLGVVSLGFIGLVSMGALAVHRWARKLPVPGLELAARTAWQTGDPINASQAARRILEVDFNNQVATRLMAEMGTRMESPEAVFWWKRVVELSPKDREAWEKLVLSHLGRQEWKEAASVLDDAEKNFPGHISWARLRCTVAASSGNLEEAVRLFRALKGSDESPGLRLALYSLEAFQADTETAKHGLAGLVALGSERNEQGRAAAGSLLKLAVQRGDQEERAKWARRLLDDPEAKPDVRLDALAHWALAGRDWKPDLAKIREESLKTARGTHRLLSWLNTRRELAEARSLIAAAPKEWLVSPPTSLSVGETYLLQADWPGLERFLKEVVWDVKDPFRRLLELRCRKEQSNLDGSATYETETMAYAREISREPAVLERVLELVRLWRWDDLRVPLLRARARSWPHSELTSLTELFGLYKDGRDLRGQLSVMIRVLEIQPTDPVAANNVAYLRLILDEETPKAFTLAAQVFEGNPKTHAFHSTYAVSLVLRKRANEALELFQELKPEEMSMPEIRFAHALALAALGRTEEATKRLQGIPLEAFAKEEWLLLERFGLHRPAAK